MTTSPSLFIAALILAAAPAAAAPVPAEFQGDWVAASAACTAPARVRIETARVTLVNGADMESFGGVEMALAAPYPVRAPNAAMQKLNARLTKLDLRKRFPLHNVPLKRCAMAGRAGAR